MVELETGEPSAHGRRAVLAAATWFGTARWVPGLPALPVTLCAIPLLLGREFLEIHFTPLAPLVVLALVVSSGWCAGTASRARPDDPVVIHQGAGLLVASMMTPLSWISLAVTTVAYLAMIRLRPWPAGALQRAIPGGAGMALSAAFAGLWANLAARTVMTLVGV